MQVLAAVLLSDCDAETREEVRLPGFCGRN
jgi:hypothetical protein